MFWIAHVPGGSILARIHRKVFGLWILMSLVFLETNEERTGGYLRYLTMFKSTEKLPEDNFFKSFCLLKVRQGICQ